MIDKYELQELTSLIESISDYKIRTIMEGLLNIIEDLDNNVGECA